MLVAEKEKNESIFIHFIRFLVQLKPYVVGVFQFMHGIHTFNEPDFGNVLGLSYLDKPDES